MTLAHCHGQLGSDVMQFDLATTHEIVLVRRQRRRQTWPASVSIARGIAASSCELNKLPLSILLSSVLYVRVIEHRGKSQQDPTSCCDEPGTCTFVPSNIARCCGKALSGDRMSCNSECDHMYHLRGVTHHSIAPNRNATRKITG